MSLPMLFAVPASAGVVAYVLTRQYHRGYAWAAWLIVLVAAFATLQPWYARTSHCEDTLIVPFIGAFAAASGAWVGISRGGDRAREYFLTRIAVESALLALVPGMFFVMSLWPCS